MKIDRFQLEDQMAPVSHYCHSVRAGDLIWVSGIVGMTKDGFIPESTAEQFDIALAAMDACLRAAGGRSDTVTKVQVFLTNIAERSLINPARETYFGEHKPASTLVEVSALVDPRMTVEIECMGIAAK